MKKGDQNKWEGWLSSHLKQNQPGTETKPLAPSKTMVIQSKALAWYVFSKHLAMFQKKEVMQYVVTINELIHT